jgi:serine phosphatase RsbU (regulator of sigma subunit)
VDEEHFVTAAYVFVDLEKSLLRYSAAGHPRSCWPPAPRVTYGKSKRTA